MTSFQSTTGKALFFLLPFQELTHPLKRSGWGKDCTWKSCVNPAPNRWWHLGTPLPTASAPPGGDPETRGADLDWRLWFTHFLSNSGIFCCVLILAFYTFQQPWPWGFSCERRWCWCNAPPSESVSHLHTPFVSRHSGVGSPLSTKVLLGCIFTYTHTRVDKNKATCHSC